MAGAGRIVVRFVGGGMREAELLPSSTVMVEGSPRLDGTGKRDKHSLRDPIERTGAPARELVAVRLEPLQTASGAPAPPTMLTAELADGRTVDANIDGKTLLVVEGPARNAAGSQLAWRATVKIPLAAAIGVDVEP